MSRFNASIAKPWMRQVLFAAAAYNLFWGTFTVLFPTLPFQWAGMEPPNYPSLWQCIGMIVGVYGSGYAIAAFDPIRHWPLVLVGLLGKVFGPLGFVWAASKGELPWIAGLTILANDIIWWAPFGMILVHAIPHSRLPIARNGLRKPGDNRRGPGRESCSAFLGLSSSNSGRVRLMSKQLEKSVKTTCGAGLCSQRVHVTASLIGRLARTCEMASKPPPRRWLMIFDF